MSDLISNVYRPKHGYRHPRLTRRYNSWRRGRARHLARVHRIAAPERPVRRPLGKAHAPSLFSSVPSTGLNAVVRQTHHVLQRGTPQPLGREYGLPRGVRWTGCAWAASELPSDLGPLVSFLREAEAAIGAVWSADTEGVAVVRIRVRHMRD